MPRLNVIDSNKRESEVELGKEPLLIGSADGCSLRLKDPRVEDRHCQIEPDGEGGYKIVDLETKSGTTVNGTKVNVHILTHGDQISIGKSVIVFEDVDPDMKDTDHRTDRIRVIRRRRGRPVRRRRVILPPRQEKVFTLEDLKVVIESLIDENGTDALDEARAVLDHFFEEHRGAPLYDTLVEERDNLYRMLEINKLLNSEHNLKRLLEMIMDSVIEMSGAERGFLILQEKSRLTVKVARNFDREAIRRPEYKVSKTVADEVIRSGKSILSADALNDPALPAAHSVMDLKLRSLLCLPFKIKDRVIGCLYIDNRFESGVFMESDLPMLQGFADQGAIAIENARLYEEIGAKHAELKKSKEEVDRLNAQLREKVEKQYVELSKARQDFFQSKKDWKAKYDYSNIIGRSAAMREIFQLLDKVIESDEPVFIHGESGTGKELVARAIHFNSKRAKSANFISENCSAIPETLLESELFGHERGAFTGAIASKPGLFELAHKGTLFLDEIGDMPIEMQKKLLRSIQEGEVRRVGGTKLIKVDVRMLSASNKDLGALIKKGEFREDLFYRLNVVKISLPPLRDRREDIPLLIDHFLDKIASEQKQPRKSLDDMALRYLQAYPWPGNVRELENEIRRAVALSDGNITADTLKEEIRTKELFQPKVSLSSGSNLKNIVKEATEEVERKVILKALEESSWKKSEAARFLGISRPTLDAKIELYNLDQSASPT